jgi:hypothetical protein
MEFKLTEKAEDQETTRQVAHVSIPLPPRTLLIMTGESRYKWIHGISYRKTDEIHGKVYERSRRVSLTIRKV